MLTVVEASPSLLEPSDFTTETAKLRGGDTVAVDGPDEMTTPSGVVPRAVAVLEIVPESMSAWVTR